MTDSKEYIRRINSEIEKIKISGEPDELYKPIQYILNLKSKRVRPILSMMGYRLFNKKIEKIYKPSIAIEFFHNFTLIHDDIMDNASLRRGNDTVHNKWNKNIGILSGDLLMIFAFKMLEDIDNGNLKEILKRFNDIAIKVCEGQQYDLNFESEKDISESDYLNMIKLKTAVLIGFSLELGGLIANQKKEITNKLYKAGELMGIAFQLMDDHLDVFGSEKFGKKIGGDIVLNKKTYLMIKLLEEASEDDLHDIKKWVKTKNKEEEKIKIITSLLKKYDIDLKSEKLTNKYFSEGMKILNDIRSDKNQMNHLKSYFENLLVRNN
ncbi:MAG: polyprenyl synthetase family protein [Cytophagales bacterium]|jgi:geranylgeranyl diphosphate synthase type II|nr:MAG: isoprenyl synthetase [Rhodothermaeota bacterium MED-G19]